MTPHPNLQKALFVLGLSVCISTLPAQNTPASPGQQPTPDRQSTKSGSDTTDKNRTKTNDASQAGTSQGNTGRTAGDKTHTPGTDATRGRTAEGSELMVGPQDQKFLTEAAQGGMMEVQLAQLAQQKASSNEVKEFAKQLEQDHSKANEELKKLAQEKNVNLPAEMGPKHQSHVAKLNSLSDDKFDKEYVKMMVSDHKKDVKEFQKQTEKAMDSHVKEFATKTLPTLQAHLQKAEELKNTSTRSRKADDTSATSPDTTRLPSDIRQRNEDPLQRTQDPNVPSPRRPGDPNNPNNPNNPTTTPQR